MTNGEYVLTSATIALSLEGGRHVAKTLPTGTCITIRDGGEINGNKLVEVYWKGSPVLMFTQDLRARSTLSDLKR